MLLLTAVIGIALQLKIAHEASSFIRPEHPLMKLLTLSGEFGSRGDMRSPVTYALDIDAANPFDRAGFDSQTPASGTTSA